MQLGTEVVEATTCIWLCICAFMKGAHDDKQVWPLRGTYEIKLLNQISDSEHHLYSAGKPNYTKHIAIARNLHSIASYNTFYISCILNLK